MPAAIAMPMSRGKGPETIANAAVVVPPSVIRATVRVVTPVRLASVAYRVRPRVCPAPLRPRAQAAAVGLAPRVISKGTRAMTTAYMAKLFSVRVVASIRNGRLRVTDLLEVSCWEGDAGAGGQGARSAKAWAGMVTRARSSASTAYVLRQLRCSASVAVSGAKTVEARPPASVTMVRARTRSLPHQRVRAAKAG
jgi:hypothetical protein